MGKGSGKKSSNKKNNNKKNNNNNNSNNKTNNNNEIVDEKKEENKIEEAKEDVTEKENVIEENLSEEEIEAREIIQELEEEVAQSEALEPEESKEKKEQEKNKKEKKDDTENNEAKKENNEDEINSKLTETKKEEVEEKTVKEKTESKEKNTSELEDKKKDKKKKNTFGKWILAIIIGVIIFVSVPLIFTKLYIKGNKVIKNVYFGSINVSNKTEEETAKLLKEAYEKDLTSERNLKFSRESLELMLNKEKDISAEDKEKILNNDIENLDEKYKKYLLESVSPEEIDFKVLTEIATKDLMGLGRGENIFLNAYTLLNCFIDGYNLDLSYYFEMDSKKLETLIEEVNKTIPYKTKEYSYTIKDKKLLIEEGTKGFVLDKEKLKENIINNFLLLDQKPIEVVTKEEEPKPINLDEIYSKVNKDAVNASYNKSTKKIVKSEKGIKIKTSLDEAKNMLKNKEAGKVLELPIEYIEPKVKLSNLGVNVFPDLLSTYSTDVHTTGHNRYVNLQIAARCINGTILNPGESFSFNRVTATSPHARGFLPAGAFVGDKVVNEVGGGVCQITSTLYNAVLYLDLDIIERTSHGMLPGYIAAGRDATVYDGSLDFRFRNNLNVPIKLVASVQPNRVTVSFYGIKTDELKRKKVVIQNSILATYPSKVKEVPDATLAKGKRRVERYGFVGYRSRTYKTVYIDGKQKSSKVISNDYYRPTLTIVKVGTKGTKPSTPSVEQPKPTKPVKPEPEKKPAPEKPKPEQPKPEKPATEENN